MRCPENPFQSGCICVKPTVFQNQMSLGVFDTQLGVQGMEGIGELWNCLALLLSQCGPSHVRIIIVTNKVILFLDRIHKKNLKWARPHIFQTPLWNFVPNKFPTNF